KLADKLGARYVAIRGEEEMKKGVWTVRDMAGSAQEDVPEGRVLAHLEEKLRGGGAGRSFANAVLRRAPRGARGEDRHAHGMGGDAARPRRCRLHRPPRPRGYLPGRGPARGVEGGPRGRRSRAQRVRGGSGGGGRPSLRRYRE